MEKKYKPATLATLQDDIENLRKLIKRVIAKLSHKAGITLNLEEKEDEEDKR